MHNENIMGNKRTSELYKTTTKNKLKQNEKKKTLKKHPQKMKWHAQNTQTRLTINTSGGKVETVSLLN